MSMFPIRVLSFDMHGQGSAQVLLEEERSHVYIRYKFLKIPKDDPLRLGETTYYYRAPAGVGHCEEGEERKPCGYVIPDEQKLKDLYGEAEEQIKAFLPGVGRMMRSRRGDTVIKEGDDKIDVQQGNGIFDKLFNPSRFTYRRFKDGEIKVTAAVSDYLPPSQIHPDSPFFNQKYRFIRSAQLYCSPVLTNGHIETCLPGASLTINYDSEYPDELTQVILDNVQDKEWLRLIASVLSEVIE